MKLNNINFKGYNNVLSAFNIPVADGKRVSLITMQLNDEGGHKDLAELRKIMQMWDFPQASESNNTFTLTYIEEPAKQISNLYFNQKAMYWGEELRELEDKYIPKIMAKEKYLHERDVHMKAYTLIASLTSRMINDKFDGEDKWIAVVIKNLFNTLATILKNPQSAFHITNTACLKKIKFQDLAIAFNRGVCRTMEHFFK